MKVRSRNILSFYTYTLIHTCTLCTHSLCFLLCVLLINIVYAYTTEHFYYMYTYFYFLDFSITCALLLYITDRELSKVGSVDSV